jgi:drug/metabolite transporter (DMT)-like permease
LKEHLNEFDFLGLFLVVSGVVLLLLGFNQSETSCEKLGSKIVYICILLLDLGSSASTIALLVVGGVVLFAGVVNEAYTKRSPIIPPRLFRVSFYGYI